MDWRESLIGPTGPEAQRLLLAIIAESGGVFRGKTRLYKAFYRSHLEHWQHHDGRMSAHPIVWMPQGPGVHRGDEIIGDLRSKGLLHVAVEPTKKGHTRFVFQLLQPEAVKASEAERDSIRRALVWLGKRGADRVSDETHKTSRTWIQARDRGGVGEVLDIYLDLLTDDEYERIGREIATERSQLESIFQPDSKTTSTQNPVRTRLQPVFGRADLLLYTRLT